MRRSWLAEGMLDVIYIKIFLFPHKNGNDIKENKSGCSLEQGVITFIPDRYRGRYCSCLPEKITGVNVEV